MRYANTKSTQTHQGLYRMSKLQSLIESAFENRANLSPQNAPADLKQAVAEIIGLLDSGKARVAEKIDAGVSLRAQCGWLPHARQR